MLRVAEVTDFQERLLRRYAAASEEQRANSGFRFGREMVLATDVLLKNTKLDALPGCAPAALSLGAIKLIAKGNDGPLSDGELLGMARQYAEARENLRVAFEALPAAQQAEAKATAQRMRAEDRARMAEAEAAYQDTKAADLLDGSR